MSAAFLSVSVTKQMLVQEAEVEGKSLSEFEAGCILDRYKPYLVPAMRKAAREWARMLLDKEGIIDGVPKAISPGSEDQSPEVAS